MRTWLALLLTVAPAIATADDDHTLAPGAQRHFDAAKKAYEAKDYITASSEFEATYKLALDPTYLFSWAQSERLGGHCARATELYKQFLATDGVSQAAVDLARGHIRTCEADAAIPPPPPPRGDKRSSGPVLWYRDPLGDTLAISGLVGITVGLVYLGMSSSDGGAASMAPSLDAHDALVADATTERRVGGTALVLGLALAGAGAYVFVTRHRTPTTVVTASMNAVYFGARF